ncbi:hypothetical protein O6R08_09485 [Cutibacterium equinum]|uniref:Uncharacterized protein n=1 Tax=Cutibacterium equinum TaxID=3016342 RepID=A0ABY7QXC6_9ACTN|nr:hypothetical protein [Cutibacterium equinum]WCC79708.1 hypothetical protein O6R08_09485 [Cutibacterium equinum]
MADMEISDAESIGFLPGPDTNPELLESVEVMDLSLASAARGQRRQRDGHSHRNNGFWVGD